MRKSTIMFLLSSLVVIFTVAPIVGHINNKTKRDSVKVDLIKAVPSPGGKNNHNLLHRTNSYSGGYRNKKGYR